MNRFRRNTYQLSNDNHDTSRNSTRFDLTTNQLSPISRNDYQENIALDIPRRNLYSAAKLTSTPLASSPKDTNPHSNGLIGLFTPNRPLRQETQLTYGPKSTSVRINETVFSPEGSPWGTSISPKIRSKAGGVKTVQTVAGPLLASTRYNIDPKVYSDVTSPGLSMRLAKYATEANSKLTHQSQYGTGQFPKVNLSASPLPLISAKNAKIRSPVTVRIAPPEASRYSPPERQKLISDVCRAESRAAPSVVQVLREISLKRHASKEDVSSDLVKKQRTEGLFDETFDILEEAKQKRTREDSPNTEEEILAKNNQLRPVKKTKTPSCFDVLNSLSSSDQYSSGVKRKASTLDLSRSGTPDIEKHFKASDPARTSPKSSPNVTGTQAEVRRSQKPDFNDKSSPRMEVEAYKKLPEQSVVRVKGILKTQSGKDTVADQQQNLSLERRAKIEEKRQTQVTKDSSPVKNKPVNFTDKLFMKAEPQTNERLRTLIQEQGNIRAKFTTDDVDEIKKEDIVNMRQTSMRARLQSMFDAISGKSKKINPDVIIHAEGTSEPTTAAPTMPASVATLSSTTSTTNINTSPIAATAVAPTVADSKFNSTTTTKHVTFNLPSSQSSLNSQNSSTKVIFSTGFGTKTTQAGNLNLEAPKLSFGNVATTMTMTSPSVPNSATFSSPNQQSTNATGGAAPSLVSSSIASSPFIASTSSVQNITQSLGNPSVNVTSATNNSLNLVGATGTVGKGFSPSSNATFTLSNHSNVTRNSNVVSSSNLGAVTAPSSTISSTNFTLESNKSIQTVKTSIQKSVPMPDFSFGAPKMSSPASVFGGNNQPALVSNQNQAATTNVSVAPATTTSFVPNSVTQTRQSTFNTLTTSGIVVSASTAATTSSQFSFGGGNTAPQTTGVGNFSFTTNTNAGKSQVPAFGGTSTQSAPAFGAAVTQNPPSFESAINFQGVQSSGNAATTTATQNVPTFGSNLTSNQNPPAFGSAVTTAQNVSTFGTVASSAPPPSFGNTSTTSSSFAFGNTAAQPSAISGFGTNTNSTAPSTIATSGTNPTFSFGSSATPSNKPGFSFGGNAHQTITTGGGTQASGTSNQIPVFGAAAGNNTAPVFGAPSTTAPPAFGPPSTTATPVFGAPSSTATAVFGGISTTTAPLFGSPATTTTSAMFDSNVNQSTFGVTSNTGASGAFGTPKTTAPPAFGTHTSESGFNYGGASMGRNVLFAGTSLTTTSNTVAAATVSPTFGGNAVTKSVFGQTKSPPSFAASISANFGNSGTPSFGNTGSTFGATENSATAVNASGFGAQASTTPAFGTQNSTVKQTPQGPPPAFGSTNSTFGTTTSAPPAFVANTATSSGFGSSAATFGTQNSTAPPSFGAGTTNTAPAFGTNVAAPFGGQSQNPAPAFGAQNSTALSFGATSNNQNAGFGFGANQTQTQQNPGFSFSGTTSNTNNNATAATPFQFGGAPPKSDGFNFNAPTTTPNMNFGATASSSFGSPAQGSNMFGATSAAVPAGGMFSIGAGSTAPRSRSSRTRRQR